MKNAILTFAAALLFTFVCATTVGDGVPLMYSPTPYPNTIYNGTQYNSTTIDGVTYNASNEWPCLTEKQYESIIPPCSLTCISESLAKDDCDVDDFVCHCTATASAKIDTNVVPCLTSGPDALCNGTEIGGECKPSSRKRTVTLYILDADLMYRTCQLCSRSALPLLYCGWIRGVRQLRCNMGIYLQQFLHSRVNLQLLRHPDVGNLGWLCHRDRDHDEWILERHQCKRN